MNPPADNPATRLRIVLEALQSQPRQRSLREAWAAVFAMDADDTRAIIVGVAEVAELVQHLQTTLTANRNGSPITLRWIQPVSEAIAQSVELDLPLSTALHHLDELTMLSLTECELLFPAPPATGFKNLNLQRATALIDDLLDALNDADIEPSAHEMLVRHILALQHALKLYSVVGDAGLYDALLSTVGALGIGIPASERKKSWFQRLTATLSLLADAVTVAPAIAAGSADLIAFLPNQ